MAGYVLMGRACRVRRLAHRQLGSGCKMRVMRSRALREVFTWSGKEYELALIFL